MGAAGEGFGDLLVGGENEFGVFADGDWRGRLAGGEFGLNVGAAGADWVAGTYALGGPHRIGVGVGGAELTAVGVKPLASNGDVVGHDSALHGYAVGGEGVAQGIEDGQGVRVTVGVAHGEQDRGVVVGGAQVAGGRKVGGLAGGGGDVEADGGVGCKAIGGVATQHVDDNAVGRNEAEPGGGRGDVGWGGEDDFGHDVFSVRGWCVVRWSALGVGGSAGWACQLGGGGSAGGGFAAASGSELGRAANAAGDARRSGSRA